MCWQTGPVPRCVFIVHYAAVPPRGIRYMLSDDLHTAITRLSLMLIWLHDSSEVEGPEERTQQSVTLKRCVFSSLADRRAKASRAEAWVNHSGKHRTSLHVLLYCTFSSLYYSDGRVSSDLHQSFVHLHLGSLTDSYKWKDRHKCCSVLLEKTNIFLQISC